MLGSQITLGCAGFTYLESQYFFKNRVKVRQNCYIWNIGVKMSQKRLDFLSKLFQNSDEALFDNLICAKQGP